MVGLLVAPGRFLLLILRALLTLIVAPSFRADARGYSKGAITSQAVSQGVARLECRR
jgi:hypothetical protein